MSDDLKLLLDEIHEAIASRRERLRSNLRPIVDTEIAAINNGAINDAIAEGKYISAVVTSAFEKRLFCSHNECDFADPTSALHIKEDVLDAKKREGGGTLPKDVISSSREGEEVIYSNIFTKDPVIKIIDESGGGKTLRQYLDDDGRIVLEIKESK